MVIAACIFAALLAIEVTAIFRTNYSRRPQV